MLVAQLTDTHVVDPSDTDSTDERYVDNNARLALAVERLNAETVQPDVVVATGDLTDNGTAAEMALLTECLSRLRAPLLALPGNHDLRSTFAAAFDQPWASDNNLSWVVDVGDHRIVGLDTIKPGSHGGLFDAEREVWLDETLSAGKDQATILAMHHPPFLSGIHWMDQMALEGADRFEALIARHPTVVRIICGHLHRPMTTVVGGVTATVGLSTVQHIELNLHDKAPVQVICDPPGYQLHHYNGTRWVTHTRHFDCGAAPIDPNWASEPTVGAPGQS